jgi:hypothetical protein
MISLNVVVLDRGSKINLNFLNLATAALLVGNKDAEFYETWT